MADEPLGLLSRFLAKGTESPDEKTNLMIKEQLELYSAFGFGASKKGYNLDFLDEIMDYDKLGMMSVKGRRADQIVEAMKALRQPMGLDIGLQPQERRDK